MLFLGQMKNCKCNVPLTYHRLQLWTRSLHCVEVAGISHGGQQDHNLQIPAYWPMSSVPIYGIETQRNYMLPHTKLIAVLCSFPAFTKRANPVMCSNIFKLIYIIKTFPKVDFCFCIFVFLKMQLQYIYISFANHPLTVIIVLHPAL